MEADLQVLWEASVHVDFMWESCPIILKAIIKKFLKWSNFYFNLNASEFIANGESKDVEVSNTTICQMLGLWTVGPGRYSSKLAFFFFFFLRGDEMILWSKSSAINHSAKENL